MSQATVVLPVAVVDSEPGQNEASDSCRHR